MLRKIFTIDNYITIKKLVNEIGKLFVANLKYICYTYIMSNIIYDVIVVGGGASGLFLAAALDEKLNVCVLESSEKTGKKILASGNGKCNLSNVGIDVSAYNNLFAKNALERFGTKETLRFFADAGLKAKVDEAGRIYPYSETASSVSDVLRKRLEKNNVTTVTSVNVDKIDFDGLFVAKCKNETFRAKKLVLATGSKAGFGLNSHNLAVRFGHKIRPLVPSLVPLKCDATNLKGLGGVRAKCRVSLFKDGAFVQSENGEVLFKDFGLSGIAVFNLSALVARVDGNYEIGINFLPDMETEDVAEFFVWRYEKLKLKFADEFFTGVFHKIVAKNIFAAAKITEVSEKNIAKLVRTATDFRVKVISPCDFSLAQVASGGLRTSDFDEQTMESKLQKGLYAVGEVLDVDGICGGFNLQWAWSSAQAAAKSINENLK